MRPRNATRRLLVGLAAYSLLAGTFACGDDGGASSASAPGDGPTRTVPAVDPGPILEAPTVNGVLSLLAQDHRHARRALGRHRLSYTADFSLIPPELPRPSPGDHQPVPREVHDELTLSWAGDDDRAPALHLRQGPAEEASREVIILGEETYSRLPHRGWLHRTIDSELHWTWLDDAERAVHDIVAFAAPQLAITVASSDDERVTLTLSRAAERGATRAPEPGSWRSKAEFSEIDGTLVLDREHGLWESAELKVAYSVVDEEGRTLTGEASLSAQREVMPGLEVAAPTTSAPFPERIRYDVERRRLLDGLAR